MKWFELLRHRRESCQLTQTELAIQAGVSLPSIQKMEAGKANPSLKTLESVFSILDVAISFQVKNQSKEASAPNEISATGLENQVLENTISRSDVLLSESEEKDESHEFDIGRIFKEVSEDFSDLRKGTAIERAGKLVKIFERVTDSRKK